MLPWRLHELALTQEDRLSGVELHVCGSPQWDRQEKWRVWGIHKELCAHVGDKRALWARLQCGDGHEIV